MLFCYTLYVVLLCSTLDNDKPHLGVTIKIETSADGRRVYSILN